VTPVHGVTRIALSESTVLVRAPVVTMPDVVGALRVSAVAQLQAIGLSVQVTAALTRPRTVPRAHGTVPVASGPNGLGSLRPGR
jgi:hypothetical protein